MVAEVVSSRRLPVTPDMANGFLTEGDGRAVHFDAFPRDGRVVGAAFRGTC
jgi:hypothetical protein